MKTLALLLSLALGGAAEAQTPKTYAPATPPRPDEQTILNARVVSVDAPGARLTVRGVDVKADGGRDETFSVAAPAASQLAGVRPGMEVLLVLRGQTVVEVKVSTKSGGEGSSAAGRASTTAPSRGAKARRTGAAEPRTTPRPAVTPQPVPQAQPMVSPQPGPVSQGVAQPGVTQPGAVVTGVPSATGLPIGGAVSIGSTASPAPLGTPFPTPRPVPTPVPVGSPPSVPPAPTIVVPDVRAPAPVLVPANAPTPVPTPASTPSPATTPTPSPST
jgi:hypothetical protein